MRLREGGGGRGKRETDAAAACNGEKWPNFGVCNGEGGVSGVRAAAIRVEGGLGGEEAKRGRE